MNRQNGVRWAEVLSDWESLHNILRARRSIRVFRDEPVSDDAVLRLLEAAQVAPSAGNRQPFRWMVVRRADTKRRMVEAVKEEIADRIRITRPDLLSDADGYASQVVGFVHAPVVIVPVYLSWRGTGVSSSSPPIGSSVLDADLRDNLFSVAAAITQMLLAATAVGLGACWMTGPLVAESRLVSLLGISPGWRMAGVIPLGIPDEQPVAPRRRALAQLVLPEPDAPEDDAEQDDQFALLHAER